MVTVALLGGCTPPEEPWDATYARLAAETSASATCPGLDSLDIGGRRVVDDLEPDTYVHHMSSSTEFYLGLNGASAQCEPTSADAGINQGFVRGVGVITIPGLTSVHSAQFRSADGVWTNFDEGVGWLCLESLSVPPPEQLLPGPAVGTWLVRYEDAVVFGSFTEASCIGVEDAGPIAHEDGGHSGYCNGEDDDMDGLIDEGAQDCNEDGVADCMQGIEEGGYCPP